MNIDWFDRCIPEEDPTFRLLQAKTVMHTTTPGTRRGKKRASRRAAAERKVKKSKKISREVRSGRGC